MHIFDTATKNACIFLEGKTSVGGDWSGDWSEKWPSKYRYKCVHISALHYWEPE